MFDTFILDGTVAILAAAVLGLELILFVGLTSRRLPDLVPIGANLFSGLFLILALRAALVGSGATAIGLFLGLGFVAHLADLVLRLRIRK